MRKRTKKLISTKHLLRPKYKLTPTRKLFKPRHVDSLPFTEKELAELQLNIKQHVLQGLCTYCGGRVFLKKFKTRGAKHDYHQNGMCHACLVEMAKEPLLESDKWKN